MAASRSPKPSVKVRVLGGTPVYITLDFWVRSAGFHPVQAGSIPVRDSSYGGSDGSRYALAMRMTRRIRFPRPPPVLMGFSYNGIILALQVSHWGSIPQSSTSFRMRSAIKKIQLLIEK